MMPIKPDPYCSFKDDKERRNALISRDIRYVLTRLIGLATFALLCYLQIKS